ncbi:MAG: hypothetical protein IJZ42_12895 [Lachnospiraceae bacterium]|nr:hypothetical protein [Lachnospiraceae bacterium]
MRKKFFAMYALVGALVASPVFTSCVDDSESASVTAIRNAKAEQLKASAAFSAAQAEYEKALTAMKEAEIAAKLAETEQDKALFEYQLATAKALYEKTALQYEQEKLNYLKTMANTENSMITNAAEKYSIAIDELNELNLDLLEAKKGLAQVGIDSTKNEAALASLVATQNKTILEKTAQIERIKAYKGETYESLYQKIEKVKVNFQNLQKDWKAAEDVKTEAYNAYTKAYNAFDKVNRYSSNSYGDITIQLWNQVTDYANAIVALLNITYDNNGNRFSFTLTPETYEVYNGSTLDEVVYIKEFSPILETQVVEKTQLLNGVLKEKQTYLGTASTAAGANDATGGYRVLEALEAALKTAQDELAALPATATASEKATAEQKVNAAELLLAQYKEDATNITRDYNNDGNYDAGFAYLQNEVKNAEKEIADFKALVAKVKEGSDEHKAWVAAQEALLAAAEAYNEAHEKEAELAEAKKATGITGVSVNAYGEARVTGTLSTGEYVTLNALLNNSVDAEAMIASLENEIATAKATIAKGAAYKYIYTATETVGYRDADGNWVTYTAEVLKTDTINGITTEELKAIYQAAIDNIEAKIDVQEALVAKYKAALDALLAAEA